MEVITVLFPVGPKCFSQLRHSKLMYCSQQKWEQWKWRLSWKLFVCPLASWRAKCNLISKILIIVCAVSKWVKSKVNLSDHFCSWTLSVNQDEFISIMTGDSWAAVTQRKRVLKIWLRIRCEEPIELTDWSYSWAVNHISDVWNGRSDWC